MNKAIIKRGVIGSVVAAGLALVALPLVASANEGLSHDNILRAEGVVISAVDSTRFVMEARHDSQYQGMKAAAQGDKDRLKFFDDERKTIEVRLSHVELPSATRQESAFTTLRGMQISSAIRSFTMGKVGYVDCSGWESEGRPLCSLFVLNSMYPEGMEVGAWTIHKGYGRYLKDTMGPHPVYDEEYTVLQSRLDQSS